MPSSPTAIFRLPTQEETELFRRRAHLAVLRTELAEREAALDHLRAQIFSFEGRYIRQVGVLYVHLDEWNARITRLEVAAESIEETERLLNETQQPTPDPQSEPTPEPSAPAPEPTLRALFREVAKRIHPDFARDHLDELHRTHLMAQANAAFLRNDAAILQRMLHGYDPSTSTGDDANELAFVLTQIDHIQQDIVAIEEEISSLIHSEMADLQRRTVLAAASGKDLLAELAAQVKGSIGMAMRRYELDLGRLRRKQARFDPTSLLSAEIHKPQT